MFAKKVKAELVPVNLDDLERCLQGVTRRIKKERNAKHHAKDKLFREKKLQNMHALRIIQQELSNLLSQY